MRTPVIAFLARAGSGKSTAADYLIEHHGAVRVSFAGPLKELARGLMDFNDEQLFGSLKETVDGRYGMTPRAFMQRLGNNARQCIGETVWVDAALNAIKKQEGRLVVIDDCRYPNEAEALAALPDSRVIKIVSPDRNSAADPNHPSEAGVDECRPEDIYQTIINDQYKGIELFRSKIQDIAIDALGLYRG